MYRVKMTKGSEFNCLFVWSFHCCVCASGFLLKLTKNDVTILYASCE